MKERVDVGCPAEGSVAPRHVDGSAREGKTNNSHSAAAPPPANAGGGGGLAAGQPVPIRRPLELALAVAAQDESLLENQSSGSADAADSGERYRCPMKMATPPPVRRSGGSDGSALRGGAAAGEGAIAATGGQLGCFGGMEDGLSAFLALALGVSSPLSPQPNDMTVEIRPEYRGGVEVPIGAWIDRRRRFPSLMRGSTSTREPSRRTWGRASRKW